MDSIKCPHPRNLVCKDERISRFIFDEKHLRTKSQATFIPPKSLKFSTYRTTRKEENEIWQIGEEYVSKTRGLPIVGRVDLSASAYTDRSLSFEPDGIPHTRHTNIVGWNTNKPDDLERRIKLAMAAGDNWYPKP